MTKDINSTKKDLHEVEGEGLEWDEGSKLMDQISLDGLSSVARRLRQVGYADDTPLIWTASTGALYGSKNLEFTLSDFKAYIGEQRIFTLSEFETTLSDGWLTIDGTDDIEIKSYPDDTPVEVMVAGGSMYMTAGDIK